MRKLFFFVLTIVFYSSCTNFAKPKEKGSGNIITQQSTISSFDAINVTDGLNVIVTMGEKEDITIQADDNLMEHIITEVENGNLKIYAAKNINQENIRIDVVAVELSQLQASAAANLKITNTVKTELFNCEVSSAANIELMIQTESLSVSASSSGRMKLKGRVDEANLSASSAGMIDAKSLVTENCTAQASSGGEVAVEVTGDLNALASSGGTINYIGNPTIQNKEISSGGNINKK